MWGGLSEIDREAIWTGHRRYTPSAAHRKRPRLSPCGLGGPRWSSKRRGQKGWGARFKFRSYREPALPTWAGFLCVLGRTSAVHPSTGPKGKEATPKLYIFRPDSGPLPPSITKVEAIADNTFVGLGDADLDWWISALLDELRKRATKLNWPT